MNDINIPLLRKYVQWVEEQEALPEIDREWEQGNWFTPAQLRAKRLLTWWDHGKILPRLHHPEAHRQLVSHCGSAYCLAGKIASDHDPRYLNSVRVDDVHCATVAAELLGLPIPAGDLSIGNVPDAHQLLFRATNRAADIRRIAESLAGEPL